MEKSEFNFQLGHAQGVADARQGKQPIEASLDEDYNAGYVSGYQFELAETPSVGVRMLATLGSGIRAMWALAAVGGFACAVGVGFMVWFARQVMAGRFGVVA